MILSDVLNFRLFTIKRNESISMKRKYFKKYYHSLYSSVHSAVSVKVYVSLAMFVVASEFSSECQILYGSLYTVCF